MTPKLVRNLIPQIISQDKKKTPIFYIASKHEYWQKLREKLIEETNEFLASENPEELADILEVIEAVAIFKKLSLKELLFIKENKAVSNGTFSKRIILHSIQEV